MRFFKGICDKVRAILAACAISTSPCAFCEIALTNEWQDLAPTTTLYQFGDALYRGTNFNASVKKVVS